MKINLHKIINPVLYNGMDLLHVRYQMPLIIYAMVGPISQTAERIKTNTTDHNYKFIPLS